MPLRPIIVFVKGDNEVFERQALQRHLIEYNRKFDRKLSLTLPKRGRRHSAVIGKASDDNHLLYQELLDGILERCPQPLSLESVRQCLVDLGEKPSTAKMIARDYYALILKVLDPLTKQHRKAGSTIEKWGQP